MPYGSAAHRVFDVPELLGSICKYPRYRDLPHISYVSRLFFRAAAPLVWENVAGAHHLLTLIPGIEVEGGRTSSYASLSITVPSYLAVGANFTRFDQYAHFVKRLDVLPPYLSAYHTHGWHELSEQAKRRALLPNLLELNVGSFSTGTHDLFLWIQAFLSPSLTSVVVEVSPKCNVLPTIPSLVAKSLLGHIEATCRDLQHLQLFLAASTEHHARRKNNSSTVADFWKRSFYERLGGFRLKVLGCTTELLSPEWIHILGELSLLESLELYMVRGAIADVKPTALPRLKNLALHSISWDKLKAVDGLGLLAGLSSLSISFKDNAPQGDCSWGLVSLMCRNSPELAGLKLEFDDTSLYVPRLSSFLPMAVLPLVDVCLKGPIDVGGEDLDQLPAVWPMVTRLEMYYPDMGFGLKDLLHFTKLPRLQHLKLNLAKPARTPSWDASVLPSPALRRFEISNESIEQDLYIPLVAEHLLSLWPNLQQVDWSQPDTAPRSPSSDNQSRAIIATLNSLIASQRDVNRLKARIIEEYGVDVLDKLLR